MVRLKKQIDGWFRGRGRRRESVTNLIEERKNKKSTWIDKKYVPPIFIILIPAYGGVAKQIKHFSNNKRERERRKRNENTNSVSFEIMTENKSR